MRLTLYLTTFAVGLAGLASAAPNPKGTLKASKDGELTFEYSSPKANDKNWIGIYHALTGGPDDEKKGRPSLSWEYAKKKKGTVKLKVPVGGGEFKAYFLAADGYKWLAKPIKVSASEDRDKGKFKVLSWNLWGGGTKINGYHKKQVKFIKDSKVDVVGLQEATDEHAKRLGEALGWNYHQDTGKNSVGIISRFPITKRHKNEGDQNSGVELALKGDKNKKLNFWSAHTTAYPYGPYKFCFEKSEASDIDKAEKDSGRIKEIKDVIDGNKDQIKSKTPFILVGDFNSPSHQDWTPKNKKCGVSYKWPTTEYVTNNTLVDTFRKVHPDPKKKPGNTWSPIFDKNFEKYKGKTEPQDRIDFIFANDGLSVVDSEVKVAGKPRKYPDHKDNEWTSDHAGVITTFKYP